jgi:hypothetical protein
MAGYYDENGDYSGINWAGVTAVLIGVPVPPENQIVLIILTPFDIE